MPQTICKHIKALSRVADKYGMNVLDSKGNSDLNIWCSVCSKHTITPVLDYPYLYEYGEKSPRP